MSVSPETLGSLASGTQIVAAVGGTVGSYAKSKRQQQAYEYQSAVSRNNALLSEWQARDALSRGQQDSFRHGLKVGQLRGTQRAALAARGVALDEGSPLAILDATDYMGALDADTIAKNTNREAWALRQQARNAVGNADVLDWRADQESPLVSAGATLLTGAGTVARDWYNRKAP